jgi:hypothetical protein
MADGQAPDSPNFTYRPTLRNLHDAGVVVKGRGLPVDNDR